MLQTPAPATDHEHLIAIYNAVRAIQEVLPDHERRLVGLEAWRNRIAGGLVVIGLLASAVLGKLLFGGP